MYADAAPTRFTSRGPSQLEDLAGDGPTEEMTRVRGLGARGVVLEDNWSRMMRLGRSEIIGRYGPSTSLSPSSMRWKPLMCARPGGVPHHQAGLCRALVLPAQ